MNVDLSALRLPDNAGPVLRRPAGPRWFAWALAALVVLVLATLLWPWLLPARAVPMAPVRAVASSPASAATGVVVAEAAGWVEPDPFPIVVRPLVSGRVETLQVLEGAAVQQGETVIARLQSALLLAAEERARALVPLRATELQLAERSLAVAQAQWTQRAELRGQFAAAERDLAKQHEELLAVRTMLAQTQGEATAAAAAARAQQALHDAGGSNAIALARAVATADAVAAAVATMTERVTALEQAVAAAQGQRDLAAELLAAPVALQGQVDTAMAEVDRARAAHAAAVVDAAIAARELGWCEVRAPIDGVVQQLLCKPGDEVGPGSGGICLLYDPQRLRARIDVPLGSVGGVHEGQQVELRSEVLGDRFVRGTVQRLQREADLLKNTLQVKVALHDPPPLLRPETLCRARFLGGGAEAGGTAAGEREFLVPAAALAGDRVFVFDPQRGRARMVLVRQVATFGDEIRVRGELSVAQRVILAPVADGEAVQEQGR